MPLEQRHLIRTFRACKSAREQAGLLPGVDPMDLARQRAALLEKKVAFETEPVDLQDKPAAFVAKYREALERLTA